MSEFSEIDSLEIKSIMEDASARLGFSMIEVQYCIGRLRFRPNNPLTTEQIAEKFGITPATLVGYEQIVAQEAMMQNPVLHALLKKEDEVNEKIGPAIEAERDRRYIADDTITLANASSCGKTTAILNKPLTDSISAKIAKAASDYIDPTLYPKHKGKTLFNRKSK